MKRRTRWDRSASPGRTIGEPSTIPRTIPSSGASRFLGHIGASTAVAAIVTLLINVMAGRVLGAEGYATFMIVWGLFFTLAGTLVGIQHEVTRSISAAASTGSAGSDLLPGAILLGACTAALILLGSLWWAPRALADDWAATSAIIAMAVLLYALANHVNGALAAAQRWGTYSAAILLEALLRALFVATALLLGTGAAGWALGFAGAGVTWLILLLRPGVRSWARSPGDTSLAVFISHAVGAMVAAACSALLVTGFPVLVGVLADDAPPRDVGVVIAALIATRAPILLLLGAYQGVIISRLASSSAPVALLRRWLIAAGALCIPAAALGFLAGPALLPAIFGAEFHASGGLFAGLVISGLSMAAITLTGWTAMSLGLRSCFISGWILAVLCTSAILLIQAPIELRVCLALSLGPAGGMLLHVVPVMRRTRSPLGRQ